MKKSELREMIYEIIEEKKSKEHKESVRKDIGFQNEAFIYNLTKLITTSPLPYEMIQGLMFSKMFHYSKQYYDGDFDEKKDN